MAVGGPRAREVADRHRPGAAGRPRRARSRGPTRPAGGTGAHRDDVRPTASACSARSAPSLVVQPPVRARRPCETRRSTGPSRRAGRGRAGPRARRSSERERSLRDGAFSRSDLVRERVRPARLVLAAPAAARRRVGAVDPPVGACSLGGGEGGGGGGSASSPTAARGRARICSVAGTAACALAFRAATRRAARRPTVDGSTRAFTTKSSGARCAPRT